MRKTIISAFAFIAMTACVQEEMVSRTESDAITFDNTYVDKATRADSFDKENLGGFNVWGFINTPAATLFEGTEVAKNEDGEWSYDESVRYWIPQQEYYFAAVAPMSSDSWTLDCYDAENVSLANNYGPGVLTFTNEDGSEDLIYARNHMTGAANGQNQPVSFHFKHLLSKVKLTFANHMGNDYIDVRVSNITVKALKKATMNLASETLAWEPVSETEKGAYNYGTLEIGAKDSESSYALFLIPSTGSVPYEISFDLELVMDGVNGEKEILYRATKTASIDGNALEIGTAYNFSAAIDPDILNLDTIEFTVDDVEEWDEASDLSKIAIASKLGGEVELTGNVTVPDSDVIVVARDLTINLNGHTLSYNGDNRMFKVIDGATLTINGNGIETSSVVVNSDNLNESTTAAYIATAYADSKIIINGGNHTTNGCTVYHANGGSVEILDGSFSATEAGYDPVEKYVHKYTLDIQGTDGEIIVRGGKFLKWDPSHSEGEDPVADFVAEGLRVVKDGEWYVVKEPAKPAEVSTPQKFDDVMSDSDVLIIEAKADIEYNDAFTMNDRGELTLNMNGYNFKGDVAFGYSGLVINDSQLTVNDCNFTGGGFQVGYAGSELILNDCNINITSANTSDRYCIYAVYDAIVTINGGTLEFNQTLKRSYFYAANNATIYVTDCVCGPASTHHSQQKPIITANGGKVIITGGRFGFDPSQWVADGYEAVKNGSTWTVSAKPN